MKIEKIAREDKLGILFAVILIAFAVMSRIIPHPANVAPIAAVALFGGALLPRRYALSLPLIAMIVSDYFIGMHSLVLFTWGSFALIALLSSYKFKNLSALNVIGSSLGASLLFFFVTNFGVWLEGRMYAPTLAGLAQCYYNALPFLRNTMLGDVIYTTVLFGLYATAIYVVRASKKQNLVVK